MLIDEVKITVKGGDGGDGVVSYKNAMMEKGPTGGDGGRGGNVYLEAVSDLSALRQFRHQKDFTAQDGDAGSNRNKKGADGEDLILKVPVGTVARNLDLSQELELTKVGEKVIIARGASGGYGNSHFRSSTNISPRQSSPGHAARRFDFVFELKLIADVGLVGLPNAGKSSLLNELTRAKSKVANYQFTTLEPNLGAYYDLILADIPGLIEGASGGRGLGIKFLRHISRCTALFHLVPADSEDVVRDYKIIREELSTYDPKLVEKPEYIFLSKFDSVDPKAASEKLKQLRKIDSKTIAISVNDWESIEQVKKILNSIAKKKTTTS
ncbi:MAG: hypothetical protein A2722_03505 [Candidatus Doudnabacteria bacterium RIFCSPHIGHO2_01_FULL_50_11]|uniref:GTPase Obg n=1 Tax=Candidatus Doudnabacteria bacterium RIFCSPHIGHO2_01_FULL_50_11 TaxID=1817828 RepID=A0A1F5PIN9_9BACT|nr:MAG: hypothetical protein A2722_03505 [Candidatus Doudnabacteria bacterium RIFCSPHIGHO2_01_FULL_50_11]HLC44391.1 GTPase ObgE [Patescibacteria group bacterium]